MIRQISSSKNSIIKEILLLQNKSRERKKNGQIVIEGKKEISLAVESGIEIEKVLFCPDIIDYLSVVELLHNNDNLECYELSKEAFSKITYRESTGGIVVVAKTPQKNLEDLEIKENSVFIILESVEKPGNLGAISRVADGAGADAIILCDSLTDIYNPNSIRSSLGCVFTTDVVSATSEEVMNWLKENDITSYAAELEASEFYHDIDLLGKIALVFGTEAHGLTYKWIEGANNRIKIPMMGVIDSLNVSTSVSVLVYEAMRQRKFLV